MTKRKFSQNLKKKTRIIKLKPDPKITFLSKSDIGEFHMNSESSSRVRRGLNLTFEPEESDQEISPPKTEKSERNTRKFLKNQKNKNHPKSRTSRSHVTTSDRTRYLNPSLTVKASIHSEDRTQERHYVLSPERPDSSVSSTLESENVSAGTSDISDMSETIYTFPGMTQQDIAVWRRRFYPNKTVYTPDKRFPFSNDKAENSYSVSHSKITTETHNSTGKCGIAGKESNTIPDITNSTNKSGKTPDDQTRQNYSPKSSEDTTDGEGSKYASFVNKKTPPKRRRSEEMKKEKSTFSETENYRLLRTYLEVLDLSGTIRRVLVAVDTQSNVSYAKPTLGEPREWRRHENRYVKGIGGWTKAETPLVTRVIKQGRVIEIDTRTPPKGLFDKPDGPEMLLGAQHCVTLGIDLNKLISSLKHNDVTYLEPQTKRSRINKNVKNKKKSKKYSHQICSIAEKLMKQYLDRTGGTDKEPKQCSIDDVFISEDFTPEQRRQVKQICQKYKDVFASSPDDIPPPLKDAKPHVFKMREGCKPVYCKRPNWGPCQRKYLEQWTRKAVAQGLMEPAPDSEWASRPVLVGKYRGNTSKKDVPDGIRTCVDFTRVNEFIVKQPPQYTDPFEEIRRACGHTFYFEADGQKQFNSVPLAEGSRDITTTWTPLGLMRWLRLIMGTKDASGRAQMEYTAAMNRYLSDEEKSHLANFQDDFLGFHNTIPGLLRTFKAFLSMCRKAGITLNPAKIRIGIHMSKFYGFVLSKKGMEPSEKNLDPIRKMTPPKDRSEVRSVMGVFNQFRHFFNRYDRLVLPIQKLLRKNEPFVWSPEANEGFEHIREKLLEGKMYLAAPDNSKPLILETDGSDDGWGAILLQESEGKRRVIKMWSKQWKTLHMRRAPPYYKETKAWMNGLENSRIYADYSPFPIKCVTDHIPLTYIKNTSGKGPVSQFVLDNLSSLDYTITYRQGSKLVEADAVSRFPCIGPKTLATDGVIKSFDILLSSLPLQWTSDGKIWVYAQSETEIIQQEVRHWMSLLPKCTPARKVPVTDSPTEDKIKGIDYSLGLWVPEADKVKTVVNRALDKKKPFACLIPSCLVNLIPENPEHKKTIQECKKIVLLQPEMTWLIFGIKSVTEHQVYSIDVANETEESFGDLQDFRGIVGNPPDWDLRTWVPLQERMIRENPEIYTNDKISTRESDGFKLFSLDPERTLALVPQEHIKELVDWQHKQLCHAGHNKVYRTLKRAWHWPDMKRTVRKIVSQCAPCQLLKAKRARAHRHFRAKVFCTPRTSWGCDFYGIPDSKNKYNNLLGAIDLATAECRLFACKSRSAEVVTDCILQGIVLRDGCPLHIHSDAAREFVSKAMKRLCELIGCQQTTTLAHHPTGNATIERLWQFVASCLKQMTKEQYLEWEKYVRLIEHTWNTSYHSVLKCSPFEAAHGLKARSAIDSLARGTGHVDTDLMTTDGIGAMQVAARAFEQQIQNARREAAASNAELLSKGPTKVYKVGDEVSFYLPPSEEEANAMGRKPRHLLQYRGPAFVTEVLSGTSYGITYEGRKYSRCFSELRPYKSDKLPMDLPIANHIHLQERRLIPGNYVALCDSADPEDDHFHLCRVLAIEDDKAVLLNYATFQRNIKTAVFSTMYQERATARYTTQKPARNAREQEVIDKVSLAEADEYVDHYDIRMTTSMKIKARSIRQLNKLGLKHHILGVTFP